MAIVDLGSLDVLVEYFLVIRVIVDLLSNDSWFSPVHLLIIEHLAQSSLFATVVLLIFNTTQVSRPKQKI